MRDNRTIATRVISRLGLYFWLFLAMFPFLWMIIISFRHPVDAFATPPQLFAPFTLDNFYQVWVVDQFYNYAINTTVVTVVTVAVSLSIACLAGYALSRYDKKLGFWLLILALIFRALPHVVLLTAYKPAFFALGIWSRYETLIIVLVAINQPFTIWLMRAFFLKVPRELDEAAMIDGCSRMRAFYHVIVPVMWPGVITAGLFSFLLAYNDYLIASQLMNGDMTTMTAALGTYMGAERDLSKLMEGIAGAVSVIIPLIFLVLIFQRYIVAGLTQGAVKG